MSAPKLAFGLAALMAAATPRSAVGKTGFEQPRFLLSFWVDPMVDPSDFKEQYRDVRNANFTAVLGGFGATTPAQIQTQIAAAEANGLGAIVHADMGLNISDLPASNSSAFWGFVSLTFSYVSQRGRFVVLRERPSATVVAAALAAMVTVLVFILFPFRSRAFFGCVQVPAQRRAGCKRFPAVGGGHGGVCGGTAEQACVYQPSP